MSGKELSRKRPVPFPLYDVDLFSATPDQLKEMSKTMGEEDFQKWVDFYLHKAEILSIATLSKFNDPELSGSVVPVAFSQLRNRTLRSEIVEREGLSESIIRAKELIAKEQGSKAEREGYLTEIYERHPAFETTIDIVKRLKSRYHAVRHGDRARRVPHRERHRQLQRPSQHHHRRP